MKKNSTFLRLSLFVCIFAFIQLRAASSVELMDYAKKGNLDKIKVALDNREFEFNEALLPSIMSSMVLFASKNGYFGVVEFLANKDGVDVNLDNGNGQTALMLASRGGYFKIAEALVNAGAEVDKKDKMGWTALMYVTRSEFLSGSKMKNDYYKLIQLLIKNGADVNAEDRNHQTPLFECRDEKAVKILLRKGANILHKGKGGTAVDYATMMRHLGWHTDPAVSNLLTGELRRLNNRLNNLGRLLNRGLGNEV